MDTDGHGWIGAYVRFGFAVASGCKKTRPNGQTDEITVGLWGIVSARGPRRGTEGLVRYRADGANPGCVGKRNGPGLGDGGNYQSARAKLGPYLFYAEGCRGAVKLRA